MALKWEGWSDLRASSEEARERLCELLAGTDVRVEAIEFGDEPPDVAIRDLHDLSLAGLKTTIEFAYNGNGYITVSSLAELNCLASELRPEAARNTARRYLGMGLADRSLKAPVSMTLRDLHLQGHVTVDVSLGEDAKRVVLEFDEEPLKNVTVQTSFDGSVIGDNVARIIKDKMMTAIKRLTAKPIEFHH